MEYTLDEIKIQIALGTLDTSLCSELYHIKDKEILMYLAFCDDVTLRRVAAQNKNTPFSTHQKQYKNDSDFLVKELAWEHIRLRYMRRFYREPPKPPWRISTIDPYNPPLPK